MTYEEIKSYLIDSGFTVWEEDPDYFSEFRYKYANGDRLVVQLATSEDAYTVLSFTKNDNLFNSCEKYFYAPADNISIEQSYDKVYDFLNEG